MNCLRCKRTNRALFTRLMAGGEYMILCDICLHVKNSEIVDELVSLRTHPRRSHHCRVRRGAAQTSTAWH